MHADEFNVLTFGWESFLSRLAREAPESRIISFAKNPKSRTHRLFPMIIYIELFVTTVNLFSVVLSKHVYSSVCLLRAFLINGSNTTKKAIHEYNDLIVNPLSGCCHQGAIAGNATDFCILCVIAQNDSAWLTVVIALLYRIVFARLK